MRWSLALLCSIGCAHPRPSSGSDDASVDHHDAIVLDARSDGGGGGGGDGGGGDGGGGDGGGGNHDASGGHDAMAGAITGGPCLSGTPGATAYRIRWANGGG